LLVDPYALTLDRRFTYDPRLSVFGTDTAALVPKAIVPPDRPAAPRTPRQFERGGVIYEVNVKGLTQLHPGIPLAQRGTVGALAHTAMIGHFQRIGVSAVELMPITAWIDERHLPPLGLSNAWGYNPVVPMALDPGLVPGGVAELRGVVAALHEAGIGVILDLVFNHSGESDVHGPILSMRGLDDRLYYARAADGTLINDTGCGNTLDFGQSEVRALALAAMRHFVGQCGVDGFRFDLAPIMARSPGFDPQAPIFAEIAADPLLADRVMIAEPWDIGPGGYQLGQFPNHWLEWNDRYRDDMRRFWRGDGKIGDCATRLAGSADIFGPVSRSVNFLAAHDGFTLADTVSYVERHNEANGEQNRDGHGDNLSWNHGVEGATDDPAILAARRADVKALLTTLFASTGTILLTAGDEFGRTQRGNNNAYAQDNTISWIDWGAVDVELLDHVAALANARGALGPATTCFGEQGEWLTLDGRPMTPSDWEATDTAGFEFRSTNQGAPYAVRMDRTTRTATLTPIMPTVPAQVP
jgi:glycogen operon protein